MATEERNLEISKNMLAALLRGETVTGWFENEGTKETLNIFLMPDAIEASRGRFE